MGDRYSVPPRTVRTVVPVPMSLAHECLRSIKSGRKIE